MPGMVPKGAPNTRPLVVGDDQVEGWLGRGYVVVEAPKAVPKSKHASKK